MGEIESGWRSATPANLAKPSEALVHGVRTRVG